MSNESMTPLKRKQLLVLAVGLEGGLVVVAWVLGVLLDIPVFAAFEVSLESTGWGMVAIVPVLLLSQRKS